MLLSSDGGKIFFSITCIIFRSRWWEQSRPEPYLFLSTSILQCRMTSWDWSLQRQYWKLFQLIFPWLKMKRKTLCISNLDSWVDQKKHLNKDAQKKCLWSGDVRWPASIFPFSRITFSSSKKLNFLIQSNIRQVPNILVFLSFLYSTYIVCMVVGKNVVLAPARM